MSSHAERIDGSSSAALVTEHVARYRFAQPAIAAADAWVDLGCGSGYAAAEALGSERPRRALMVDIDAASMAQAGERLTGLDVDTLRADLSAPDQVARVADWVGPAVGDGRGCITCFEVFEHLDSFVPLLEALIQLASERCTVVLSVPNDAFWSQHNPYHRTTFGGDAFEEFRSLLPDDHVVARQVPLGGTSIQALDSEAQPAYDGAVVLDPEAEPSHFLAVFGPGAGELDPTLAVAQADILEQRGWERQRDADLAWMRQREEDLAYYETEAKRLQEELDEVRSRSESP
jgi:SAM-dependent methyltransferase